MVNVINLYLKNKTPFTCTEIIGCEISLKGVLQQFNIAIYIHEAGLTPVQANIKLEDSFKKQSSRVSVILAFSPLYRSVSKTKSVIIIYAPRPS